MSGLYKRSLARIAMVYNNLDSENKQKIKPLIDKFYATAKNIKDIKSAINIDGELQAPIIKDQKVGTITVKTKYDQKTYDIFANETVKSVNIFEKIILKIYEKFKK